MALLVILLYCCTTHVSKSTKTTALRYSYRGPGAPHFPHSRHALFASQSSTPHSTCAFAGHLRLNSPTVCTRRCICALCGAPVTVCAQVRVYCFNDELETAGELVLESGDKAAAYHLAKQHELRGNAKAALFYFEKALRYNHAVSRRPSRPRWL